MSSKCKTFLLSQTLVFVTCITKSSMMFALLNSFFPFYEFWQQKMDIPFHVTQQKNWNINTIAFINRLTPNRLWNKSTAIFTLRVINPLLQKDLYNMNDFKTSCCHNYEGAHISILASIFNITIKKSILQVKKKLIIRSRVCN